jgi:hypothetical protein
MDMGKWHSSEYAVITNAAWDPDLHWHLILCSILYWISQTFSE